MAGELKVWVLGDGAGAEVVESVTVELEERLEETLVRRPEMLEPKLQLVGRQIPTEGGPLDLLGVDAGGRLVVFELKRGKLPREAVTQCIDYASALNERTPEQIAELITEHSGGEGIEEIPDFEEWYLGGFPGNDLSGLLPPRVVLVGLGVDARAERMARFLSEGGIRISVLTFFGFQREGETLLARQVEVEQDETASSVRRNRKSAAEKRQVLQRRLSDSDSTELFEEIAEALRDALPKYSETTRASGISFLLPFGERRRVFCLLSAKHVGARVQWYATRELYDAGELDAVVDEGGRLGWQPGKWGLDLDIPGQEQWEQVRDSLIDFVQVALKSWNSTPQGGAGDAP